MSIFKYSEQEKELNKVLKMNQGSSLAVLQDGQLASVRASADQNIAGSEEILRALGYGNQLQSAKREVEERTAGQLEHRPILEPWETIAARAEDSAPQIVTLEDILSPQEIDAAFQELDEINTAFARQTGIVNKTDLSFLAIATALQVTKSLLFPYVAEKFGYGESFDASQRLAHDDKSIKETQRAANDTFRDDKLKVPYPFKCCWLNQ